MGCQQNIAEQMVDKGGDYILALKGKKGSTLIQLQRANMKFIVKCTKVTAKSKQENILSQLLIQSPTSSSGWECFLS